MKNTFKNFRSARKELKRKYPKATYWTSYKTGGHEYVFKVEPTRYETVSITRKEGTKEYELTEVFPF